MSFDVWRELERPGPESVVVQGIELRSGARVRLWPSARRDVWDTALKGRTAVVETIEELVDGGVVLTVSPEDDPGRDLGAARPGHRFFFTPDEVEPLTRAPILVAGIGNIFLGDDGFGCEVARRVAEQGPPDGADVRDFGIRGFDLAYALASGYDAAILVDAAPLGERPGTVVVLEPSEDDGDADVDPHGMDPVRVLRLARELGGAPPRTVVVACEPERVVDPDAGEDVLVELSAPVRAAVDAAAETVRRVVAELKDDLVKGGGGG